MTKQYKIFLTGSIIAIIALAAWGMFFNYGNLTINSKISNFTVKYSGNTINCQLDCDLKLKPGSYNFTIESPGYTSMEYTAYLLKNEQEDITYAPLKNITLKPAESYTEITTPSFINSSGGQQLTFKGEVITTFKNPLNNPKVILSPTLKSAFIYLTIVAPVVPESTNAVANANANANAVTNADTTNNLNEYYFVDLIKKSKEKISLEFSSPTNFNLVSDTFLTFDSNGKVINFNLTKAGYTTLPINTSKHIMSFNPAQSNQESEADQFLILTSRSLDQDSSIISPATSVKQLTNLDALSKDVQTPPNKIYLYNSNTSSYSFLQELESTIVEPIEFKTVMINQKPVQVLSSNQKYYQISK